MFLPHSTLPEMAARRLVDLNQRLDPNDPTSTLTVMASYNDHYQMGMVNVFLPRNPAYKKPPFQAAQPMEGATAAQVIARANHIFESLLRQLANPENINDEQ